MIPCQSTEKDAVDIVIIGHFSKDRLVIQNREEISSGRSVYYGAIALKRIGRNVAVVTRLKKEDFSRLGELKDEGVLIFAQPAEQTSGVECILHPSSDGRILRPLGFAGPFEINNIPKIKAKIYFLGPIMPGEMDLAFLQAISKCGPLALDI